MALPKVKLFGRNTSADKDEAGAAQDASDTDHAHDEQFETVDGESMSFMMEGKASIGVSISENGDGTLTFTLDVFDSHGSGNVQGVFLDAVDDDLSSGLFAQGAQVDGQAFAAGGVDGVMGHSSSLPPDGDLYDGGVSLDPAKGPATFTLGHVSAPLFLEDFEGMDMAVRLSPGDDDPNGDSLKVEGQVPLLQDEPEEDEVAEDDDTVVDFPVPMVEIDEQALEDEQQAQDDDDTDDFADL